MENEFLANGGELVEKLLGETLEWQTKIAEINPMHISQLTVSGSLKYPFYGQATQNNGIISYETLDETVLNNPKGKPTLLVHSNNQNIVYLETPFYLKDGHGATSVLQHEKLNKLNAMYFSTIISKVIKAKFDYNAKATKIGLKNTQILVPMQNGEIAFDYMERFVRQLHAFLKVSNLSDVKLSKDEENALAQLSGSLNWQLFNLKALFGSATRGKRLKSSDRIDGDLPFVTAGEANTGISAFIGNPVQKFAANTATIDMFGSAKYRHYEYGADDHVAVVHTQNWAKHAVLFATSAMHKVANAGQFSYSRNFYAKDADELNILLPEKNGKPDVELMALIGRVVEKLVIADVVAFSEREMAAYEQVIA